MPASFAPHSGAHTERQRSDSQPAPQSFAPASRSTRNSQASSSSVRSPKPHNSTPSAHNFGHTGKPSSGATRAHSKHRVRNIILTIIVVLALVLGFGLISTYNWVNSNLHKEEWLSGASDTAGTSWLILGSDERDGTTGALDDTPGERTDTILILTKPKHGPSSLISVPRDSLVQVGDEMLKINAVMQQFGKKELVKQVESITGQHIDHVAKLTFGGLTKVVDALGGIELCYDQDVDDEKSGLQWKAGCHVVNGTTALAFSRMRYSDPRSDFGRSDRQRQVIGAIASKATSRSTLMNFGKLKKTGEAALGSLTVDDRSTPWTMLQMLLAFRDASGSNGITGSLYWSDPGYYVDGVGSSVLLDDQRNLELFKQLREGDHAAGQVGSTSEQQ